MDTKVELKNLSFTELNKISDELSVELDRKSKELEELLNFYDLVDEELILRKQSN